MATATLPKNGIKQDSAKSATSEVRPLVNAPNIKVEAPTPEAPEPQKPRTIHDELNRIRERSELADKLEQTIATKTRLERFKLASGGLRDQLKITDGTNEFTTTNTAVLESVYDTICKTVDVKIAEMEAALLA